MRINHYIKKSEKISMISQKINNENLNIKQTDKKYHNAVNWWQNIQQYHKNHKE